MSDGKAPARRVNKIIGYSVSNQFKDQLQKLIESIAESSPQYVRCIKPNKIASVINSDFDDQIVNEQLRAGSILEAVRIRKIGYGYRMEYDDFAEKYWPLLGERIYGEADDHVTKMIFEKAASMYDDAATKAILNEGEESGWRCG